jgi:hypothetical protein
MDPRVEKLLRMANAGKDMPTQEAPPVKVEAPKPFNIDDIINESAELVDFIEGGGGSAPSDTPKVAGRDIVKEKLTEGAMVALEACGTRPTKFIDDDRGTRETLDLMDYLIKRVQ